MGLLPWRAADKGGSAALRWKKLYGLWRSKLKHWEQREKRCAALQADAALTFKSPTVPFICHTHSHIHIAPEHNSAEQSTDNIGLSVEDWNWGGENGSQSSFKCQKFIRIIVFVNNSLTQA